MYDKELYRQILDIKAPWEVDDVAVDRGKKEVRVRIGWTPIAPLICPKCGVVCPQYDRRERSWRHLDTCQYQTILTADLPRVECKEHGVLQVAVAWATAGSRLTALFERLVIDWLSEASIKAVAEQLQLSWDEVDGVMQRAVERGMERREAQEPTKIGVDETSFQKHHEYVTVINDLERKIVIDVLDDHTQETLEKGLKSLGQQTIDNLEVVTLDMWQPYIAALEKVVPNASDKISFDRFHVAKHIGDAVNKVRSLEHSFFLSKGDSPLKRSKYLWLKRAETLDIDDAAHLKHLCQSAKKTARAWSLKELARLLWQYTSKGWARRAWLQWCSKAMRSRLEPMKKVARMVRGHLVGIINAIVKKVSNASAEAINGRIQWIKKSACGFRNRARFRISILFHLGGLDLYPRQEIQA